MSLSNIRKNTPAYYRIVVIGSTGCGKSTFAKQLANQLGLPHIELDAFHWGSGWKSIARETFRENVSFALRGEFWVADGNFDYAQDIIWKNAQLIIWLDYGLNVVLWRVLKRTLIRLITKEVLWNGNVVTWKQVFCKNSVIMDALFTYGKRKSKYRLIMAHNDYHFLEFVHLQSPRAADEWLSSLSV
jgi:adenylate kinase family enzyme